MKNLDHLIFASPDLQVGIDLIEELLGVQASIGGRHIGLGTRNALIALGPKTYLEIIAPDPEQLEFRRPRLFGINENIEPRLITWVARTDQLEALAARQLDQGKKLGEVLSGSRKTPEGSTLTWQFTDPFTVISNGIVPFFIDWGQSAHPAKTAPQGAQLIDLHTEHPDPPHVQKILKQLELDLPVFFGTKAALIATIECPNGLIELR